MMAYRDLLYLRNILYLTGGMMANVRRFDIVATYDGKLDIAEQDSDSGLYCRAAELAQANATIERLRSELEAEQARTICYTCGKELTAMAQKMDDSPLQSGAWIPINNSKVQCTEFTTGGANQHGDYLVVWSDELNEGTVHLPDDVRLCRKVTP